MTPKEIFDKKYLYYRDILNKPSIPLEARQLIFDVMEEYYQSKVNNSALDDVSNCKHNVKNWNSERGTYLCSNCGKDFTTDL